VNLNRCHEPLFYLFFNRKKPIIVITNSILELYSIEKRATRLMTNFKKTNVLMHAQDCTNIYITGIFLFCHAKSLEIKFNQKQVKILLKLLSALPI